MKHSSTLCSSLSSSLLKILGIRRLIHAIYIGEDRGANQRVWLRKWCQGMGPGQMAFSVTYTRQLLYPLPCEYGRPQGSWCGLMQDVEPSGTGVIADSKGSTLWSSFPLTPGPRRLGLGLLSKVRGTDSPCCIPPSPLTSNHFSALPVLPKGIRPFLWFCLCCRE